MFWKKKVEIVNASVKDPICGMNVDPNNAYYTEIGGKMHYFCGAGCKAAFKKANTKEIYGSPLKVRKVSRGGAGGCCH